MELEAIAMRLESIAIRLEPLFLGGSPLFLLNTCAVNTVFFVYSNFLPFSLRGCERVPFSRRTHANRLGRFSNCLKIASSARAIEERRDRCDTDKGNGTRNGEGSSEETRLEEVL